MGVKYSRTLVEIVWAARDDPRVVTYDGQRGFPTDRVK